MAQDAGGNYVDENSDYSFQCCYCNHWFYNLSSPFMFIPEIPGYLCPECLSDYKEVSAKNAHTEMKQEMKVTGEYR